jgi:hypothetical protein
MLTRRNCILGLCPSLRKGRLGVSLCFALLQHGASSSALRAGDYPPPNSTLTSHTPLSLAMPRQKTLRQAQRLLLNKWRNMKTVSKTKFSLGQCVATPGAREALRSAEQSPIEFLARHVRGDWGEVSEHDAEANALALEQGFRILSAYRTWLGEELWIITEADRSVTTILLPDEY